MTAIRTFGDASALSQAAADHWVEIAAKAINQHERFSVALSGGSTPRTLYQLLASDAYKSRIDWEKVHIFWGDERCVPPDDAESCYRMAKETLLDYVPIPPSQIYRISGEIQPEEAAAEYEKNLRHFFSGDWPRFDLILLGMGDDGHTASLFPDTAALDETTKWVTANYAPTVAQHWRVTLTIPTINNAANIDFLVSGTAKAERLKQVLKNPPTDHELPSQLIDPFNGALTWFVDRTAASSL